MFDSEEAAQAVNPQDLHVLVRLGRLQHVHSDNAGVGEEGIEPAFFGDGLLAYRGDGLLVGGVRFDGSDLEARVLGFELLGKSRERGSIEIDYVEVLGACIGVESQRMSDQRPRARAAPPSRARSTAVARLTMN